MSFNGIVMSLIENLLLALIFCANLIQEINKKTVSIKRKQL
jgi:hypothetical protein